jgi:hypothetical protein
MSAGFLLDANVPSETLRPVPHARVTALVEAHSDIQFVSVVSIGELRRGRRRTIAEPIRIVLIDSNTVVDGSGPFSGSQHNQRQKHQGRQNEKPLSSLLEPL